MPQKITNLYSPSPPQPPTSIHPFIHSPQPHPNTSSTLTSQLHSGHRLLLPNHWWRHAEWNWSCWHSGIVQRAAGPCESIWFVSWGSDWSCSSSKQMTQWFDSWRLLFSGETTRCEKARSSACSVCYWWSVMRVCSFCIKSFTFIWLICVNELIEVWSWFKKVSN